MVTLAAGAAAGKFLRYEENAPTVAAQTAYGIEATVVGYGERYDPRSMLFMDFRRHHSGAWAGAAHRRGVILTLMCLLRLDFPMACTQVLCTDASSRGAPALEHACKAALFNVSKRQRI